MKNAGGAPFRQENGNALFLILIAVALFAALSYAITQSSRGGGGGVNAESMTLAVAQMIQYGTLVQQAVQRLQLANGCTDLTLSFHYDSDRDGTLETNGDDDYYNPSSPADKRCHIFQPEGGGLTWQDPPAQIVGSGTYRFACGHPVTGLPNSGTAAGELHIGLTDVTPTACDAINRANGYTGAVPTNGSPGTYVFSPLFVGSCGFGGHFNQASIRNNYSGCVHSTVSDTYQAYFVLIDR